MLGAGGVPKEYMKWWIGIYEIIGTSGWYILRMRHAFMIICSLIHLSWNGKGRKRFLQVAITYASKSRAHIHPRLFRNKKQISLHYPDLEFILDSSNFSTQIQLPTDRARGLQTV
jgi:hypothetical protein